jgi:alkylation response protein AidB-like acyl-CoA dehydrogenase
MLRRPGLQSFSLLGAGLQRPTGGDVVVHVSSPELSSIDERSRDRSKVLIEAITESRAVFEGAAREAEIERRLPASVVEVLRDLGVFWLKTPLGLGGSELDPIDFCDVLEHLAYFDASAAWAVMVGNGTTGTFAGWLPDEGVEEIFADPESLPILAGQFIPRGRAEMVDGGFEVTGRWSFSSGIDRATWVAGGCSVAGSSAPLLVCVPKYEATVYDTWEVAGLQGRGSNDFSLERVFVPERRTMTLFRSAGGEDGRPRRGGAQFRQAGALFVANELGPVAVGIARRAFDDMAHLAGATSRQVSGTSLGERALGRSEATLRSAQLLYRDAVCQPWECSVAGTEVDALLMASVRSCHTLTVELCLSTVAELFRYGGGRVISLSKPVQRHYRNLMAAAQHLFVYEECYEVSGLAHLDQVRQSLGSD